jgi:hypothetical protein
MRASFETEERLTLETRVGWLRTRSSGNVFVLYVGPDNDEGPAAAAAMIRSVNASRISTVSLVLIGLALMVVCTVIATLMGRSSTQPVRE